MLVNTPEAHLWNFMQIQESKNELQSCENQGDSQQSLTNDRSNPNANVITQQKYSNALNPDANSSKEFLAGPAKEIVMSQEFLLKQNRKVENIDGQQVYTYEKLIVKNKALRYRSKSFDHL